MWKLTINPTATQPFNNSPFLYSKIVFNSPNWNNTFLDSTNYLVLVRISQNENKAFIIEF
jgi:hypothetical protein